MLEVVAVISTVAAVLCVHKTVQSFQGGSTIFGPAQLLADSVSGCWISGCQHQVACGNRYGDGHSRMFLCVGLLKQATTLEQL
jgi:hypothetical protein